MTWEIQRAKESDLKLRLTALKLAHTNTAPPGLLGIGTARRGHEFRHPSQLDSVQYLTSTSTPRETVEVVDG